MSVWERRIQYVANLLVGGTGVLYAVMRYLMQPVDEWAVVNHPWQSHVQHLHILAAPLLVFACGLIWHRHVISNWKRGADSRSRTGIGLAASFVPMITSGYLIQTSVTEVWRETWIVVHLVTSLAWVVVFVWHLIRSLRQSVRSPGARHSHQVLLPGRPDSR